MARLNQNAPALSATEQQNSSREEAAENGSSSRLFYFFLEIINLIIVGQDQSDAEASQMPKHVLSNDADDQDDSVDEGVLDVFKNITVSKSSPQTLEESGPPQTGRSMTKTLTELLTRPLRFMNVGAMKQPVLTGNHHKNNNTNNTNNTDKAVPSEFLGNKINQLTATNAIKRPSQLGRPAILRTQLNKHQPPSLGKPDPYDIQDSPEKVNVEPASTEPRPRNTGGLKRKRKDPIATAKSAVQPEPAISKTRAVGEISEDELEYDASDASSKRMRRSVTRARPQANVATRSHGSAAIVQPVDYSKPPEKVGFKVILVKDGMADIAPTKRGRPKKIPESVQGQAHEPENGNMPSSPNDDYHMPEESPGAVAGGARRSKRAKERHGKDAITELRRDAQKTETIASLSRVPRKEQRKMQIQEGRENNDVNGDEVEQVQQDAFTAPSVDEGISDMLLHPSPEKLQPQTLKAGTSKHDNGKTSPEVISGDNLPSVQPDDGMSDPGQYKESRPHLLPNATVQTKSDSALFQNGNSLSSHVSTYFGKNFVGLSRAEEMVELMEKIGRDKDGYLKISKDNLATNLTTYGKGIRRRTELIISAYEAIQEQRMSNDPDAATLEDQYSSVIETLDQLEEKVDLLIKTRLGDPEDPDHGDRNKDKDSRARMLKDVYMRIMPDIVKVLKAAIVTYGKDRLPSTDNLTEILRYTSLLQRLLETAGSSHNTEYRPKTETHTSYKIKKPYASLKPLLKAFVEQCAKEIALREERAEVRRRAPELAKEKKEKAEALRLKEEALRIMRQRQEAEGLRVFNQKRMELGMPPLRGQVAQPGQSSQSTDLARAQRLQDFAGQHDRRLHRQSAEGSDVEDYDMIPEAELTITEQRIRADQKAKALALKLKEAESLARKLKREEERLLQGHGVDEEEEGAEIERVEMFPADNNHAPAVQPWTMTEYEVLLDGLKLESGMSQFATNNDGYLLILMLFYRAG